MPCPFTGLKMFCAGTKCFVPVQTVCARPIFFFRLALLQKILRQPKAVFCLVTAQDAISV